METEQPTQPIQETKPKSKPKAKKQLGIPVAVLIAVVLMLAGAGGAWLWRSKDADKQSKNQQDEISELQAKVTKAEKDLADEKSKSEEDNSDKSSSSSTAPSSTALENIKASITSGNTAALEGYMASTVNVIIAASEGMGNRTPTQAITDLEYLDAGTDPWNFSLSAATLADYASGDYSQYFPSTALVGKSANNYVVSFNFNSSGKISGIFMAVNANLL